MRVLAGCSGAFRAHKRLAIWLMRGIEAPAKTKPKTAYRIHTNTHTQTYTHEAVQQVHAVVAAAAYNRLTRYCVELVAGLSIAR